MGKVKGILQDVSNSSKWIDRQTACDVINAAARRVLYDPPALVRERGRAPTPQAVDGGIRYSRAECETYGRQLAKRRAEKGARNAV